MSPEPTARYMPDLSVGEAFETGAATLTRDDIVAFARQFDPQPMHLGEESAKGTVFRRLVASGWHVAAVTMRLMVDAHPFGANPLVGLEVNHFTFHKAVEPGTTLKCRAAIQSLEPGPKQTQGHVTMLVETFEANTGVVVLSQVWKLLVPTQPYEAKSPQ